MKGICLTSACLILCISVGLAQSTFTATASTAWNLGTTWGGACASGCAAGIDYPGALDDAYIQGFSVRIPGGNFSVNNLYVAFNTINGITKSTGTVNLTINGELAAIDPSQDYIPPTVSVINNTATNFTLIFTGASTQDVINPAGWSASAPLKAINFNPASSATTLVIGDLAIANSGLLTLQNGTLRLDGALQTAASATSATVTCNVGTTLLINTGNIAGSGGGPATSFPTVTINGTLTSSTSSTSYVNATTFNLGANANLNIGFSGANQTQGWWYQSNSPSSISLDATSTVNYSANTAQNVQGLNYGNLTLSGSGTITKTSVGGTLLIAGGLTVNSSNVTFNSDASTGVAIGGILTNNGTWAPADLVVFNGTGAQSIAGGSTTAFNGGFEVNKSTGTLTVSRAITLSNGLSINQGILNLGSQIVTITNGNIDNDGTLTAGSSSLFVNGTTSITGVSSTSLNAITTNAGANFTAANNLTIGGTLTNNGTFNGVSGNININGNFANSVTGSFVPNGGTVTFGGASAQSISGAGAIDLNNIIIANSNGVNNNGIIRLGGTFTLSSGAFDADGTGSGSFTLLSSSLTTGGRIASLTIPSNFSGNVTLQRMLPAGADWRYLSMPLFTTTSGGTTNVSQWKANFPVTGNFSDASPTSVGGVTCASPGTVSCASIYTFNAAAQDYAALGSGASVASTSLDYRVGYAVYAYSGATNPISVSGAPVKGSISIPINASGTAWNLIPNPYPSPIDWDNVTTTNTTNTVYLTTAEGSFATYLKGSGTCTGCSFNTGWRGELAIGQSFWIQSAGATSIAMDESAKTTSTTFVREGSPDNYFRVTLKGGSQEDDMIVRFVEGATAGLEYAFDAAKKQNENFINLSSYNSDPSMDFAINGLPLSCTSIVKLKVTDVTAGTFSLKFTELESLQNQYQVVLKDKFLNQTKKIGSGDEYHFTTTTDPATFGTNRFELQLSSTPINSVDVKSLSPSTECNSDFVSISLPDSQQSVNYQLFLGNTTVGSQVLGNGQTVDITIPKSSLIEGDNKLSLKLSSVDGCNSSLLQDVLTYEYESISEVTSVADGKNCGEGKVTLGATGAPTDGYYRWYASSEADVPIEGANSTQFMTEDLTSSKDYYVTTVTNSGCESLQRVKVTAHIVNNPLPLITVEGTTLLSSSKSNNQWYKDGNAIEGATTNSLEAKESGTYSVTVEKEGCVKSSAGRTIIITGLEKGEGNNFIQVYPNPVQDILVISMPDNLDSKLKGIQLVDSKGSEVVSSHTNPELLKRGNKSIDLKDVRNGLLIVIISTTEKIHTFRIIKK
jgi:hypothetical protein